MSQMNIVALLERKQEMVIYKKWFFLFFFLQLFVISCMSDDLTKHEETNTSYPEDTWETKNLWTMKLSLKSPEGTIKALIPRLIETYNKDMAKPFEGELEFVELYFNIDNGRHFVMYDILYVTDTQIVFVLDADNVIIDKFIYSFWNTKRENSYPQTAKHN